MDVFAFRNQIVEDYERFSRSFVKIRAEDIRRTVDDAYRGGRFCPDPLIQLNPNFVKGGSIDELAAQGVLDAECANIFRLKKPAGRGAGGEPLVLHRHQTEAIAIAKRGESYVLTTGTGSGKSLSYFIPIVDDVLRRKKSGDAGRGISAIVVYPMNALCNSQLEELEKFLVCGYGKGNEPVTFARYTGQESNDERERIAKNPPDILLTNYVMLELILTRFLETDKTVRKHAAGLRFLVLDELHTYRGRQGADVAMLVRRVRERFNENLLCIGTSATMASEGSAGERNAAVAAVAGRLFGAAVKPANVVTETLERVTRGALGSRAELRRAIEAGVPAEPTHAELTRHPIAAWVEWNLGLEERDGKLARISRPRTVEDAAARLAEESGLQSEDCRRYLADFLLAAWNSRNESRREFFAFRLHQFISGAWNAYSTLEAPGKRFVTLHGQQLQPGRRDRRLFNLAFCRECGQEYFPVWAETEGGRPRKFSPRDLAERSNEDEELRHGYLLPDNAAAFVPAQLERHYPENWLELRNGAPRLKPHYRRYSPIEVQVDTRGKTAGEGLPAWFVPGSFRFCLNPDCAVHYEGRRSDLSKLSGLSSEGRSSATTVLALSALKHLIGADLNEKTKKLLAFTDNRQDASLQAGHFNDFIQILLLRGALLAAVRQNPKRGLTDDVLTQRVLDRLRLTPADYAANPEAKGLKARNTLKTLRDVLGYRLYFDLQRGWRIANPNLEQLNLLDIRYRELEACCQDEEEWRKAHPLLGAMTPEQRFAIARDLLDRMRKALCIKTIYLDPSFQEQIRNRSFNELKEPWGLSEEDRLEPHAVMVPRPASKIGGKDSRLVHVSHRSAFGRKLRSKALAGAAASRRPQQFGEQDYNALVDGILSVLTVYGYVEPTDPNGGRGGRQVGYRIDSSVLEWRLAAGADAANRFFRALYDNAAKLLEGGEHFLHRLEAREHTAQVEAGVREEREMRFRKGLEDERIADGRVEPAGLPILFCSPTMELGIDISTLNAVYMRNAPPTPANYAQRSGRAGRSGQPALVITYCAARSPHDQYFFSEPARMVAGAVNAPSIDLANEDLVRSHLHAVWLVETQASPGKSVREALDLENPVELPLRQDLAAQIRGAKAVDATKRRARRILATLEQDLSGPAAPWYTERWLDSAVNSAERRFDEAFRRWRSLYLATSRQMQFANAVLHNAAATERERQEAKSRYDEAYTQQNLLLESKATMNSDFHTYRYLAAEGFLPGYNFPRLPLMAFIPGRRERLVRDSFLSRPRFLGLSEFGPRSIIYHEGSTYRVRRALLAIRGEGKAAASAGLPVQAARICPACGYGHFREHKSFERCANCAASLADSRIVSNLYRIEQVSTRRDMRITSDEEERQRQGYETITTLRFAEENRRPRVERAELQEKGETLLKFEYGPAATLWRINLGWRRRREKSIYGFSIDAHTGEWTKDDQAPTDAEDDGAQAGKTAAQMGKTIERITPFVEDTRNILVVRPGAQLSDEAMISLQYALKRGIEQEFQLEEAELAAEPLPERDKRAAVLFYEAAEGGAGVLTRLASDPEAIKQVARKALEVCHYASQSGGPLDAAGLENREKDCEAGCYRCLLSYYNQPDHERIDRRNEDMLDLLCRLARSERKTCASPPGESFDDMRNASHSSLEKAWLDYLKTSGRRLPDRAQPYLEQFHTRPDFAYAERQTLIYIDGPVHRGSSQKALDAEITRRLRDAGFTVVRFPAERASWGRIADEYAWVFGKGKAPAAE